MKNSQEKSESKLNILPVILSGGSGTRLWPLSRASFPKQYLKIYDNDEYTLLQKTYKRLKGIKNLDHPLIICNEEKRFIVAKQMRELNITQNQFYSNQLVGTQLLQSL